MGARVSCLLNKIKNSLSFITTLAAIFTTMAIICTAIFAGLAYLEAKRQAEASEGQLAEFKKQTVISENVSQPYVLFVIKGDKLPVTSQEVSLTAKNWPFEQILRIENFGNVPAIIKKVVVGLSLGMSRGYQETQYHLTDLILETKGSAPIIFSPPLSIQLTSEDNRHLIMGDDAVFLQGELTYEDVSGTSYLTELCLRQGVTSKNGLRTDLQPASKSGCDNKVSRK